MDAKVKLIKLHVNYQFGIFVYLKPYGSFFFFHWNFNLNNYNINSNFYLEMLQWCSNISTDSRAFGPVQMLCFCRAEPNSRIRFYKSTPEAQCLNQTFELSSAKRLSLTSSAVLHDSGTAAIQTACLCLAKQNS